MTSVHGAASVQLWTDGLRKIKHLPREAVFLKVASFIIPFQTTITTSQ